MDFFLVNGGSKLNGTIEVEGSKNASLPIMAASLIFNGEVNLINIPDLVDIKNMVKLLESFGSVIESSKSGLSINNKNLNSTHADYELVRKMRASFFVLGPLLARFKKAHVSLPGGCAIGTRPVDIHLDGLKRLGVEIKLQNGYVEASAETIVGNDVPLNFPSVGATENIMMCACLGKGITRIINAACEPEIVDLANFLNMLGCQISGQGTSIITIIGIESYLNLKSPNRAYRIIDDRICAATYALIGIMTNSQITVKGFNQDHLKSFVDVLTKMNASFKIDGDVFQSFFQGDLKAVDIQTGPYPMFPTDLQAQVMSLMTKCHGVSSIQEDVFENRFMHVPELCRLGAQISVEDNKAFINGPNQLTGAPVMCTDLRASAALVLAALSAQGESKIQRVYHLDRGYEQLDLRLNKLGASILRQKK
jgi:UDP-N-acetylglucosamine 1-carboxyvinyltransferase